MDENEILNLTLSNSIQEAYVLAVFENKVCIGKYENNKLIFYNDNVNYSYCSQIRIFNEDLELRIVKNYNKIYHKLINDKDYGEKLNDEYMFVSGNKIVENNKEYTIIEQIGRKIVLPFSIKQDDLGKGLRLVVRNYCNIDENNQVIISESRLVGFSFDGKEVF